MDNAPLWGGVLVALFLLVAYLARGKGKAIERASRHKARAADEKDKADALQEAIGTDDDSARDRLRKLARKRSGLPD